MIIPICVLKNEKLVLESMLLEHEGAITTWTAGHVSILFNVYKKSSPDTESPYRQRTAFFEIPGRI